VDPKFLGLKELYTNNESTVCLSKIRSNFIFAYCSTCHSLQGSSVDGALTIFDYNHYFASKRWLWTALTRARDLDQVYFYDYDDADVKQETEIKQYFSKKVSGYKTQDTKAKRTISSNYINVEWCLDNFSKRCSGCNCAFTYEDGKSNFTANRLNNEFDHNLANIEPMCVLCNTSSK
jgi:hypothetical protein